MRLIIAFVIILTITYSCGEYKKDNIQNTDQKSRTNKFTINDDAFVALTESDFDLLSKASSRYDEQEIKYMIAMGNVFIFNKGDKVTILDRKFGMIKVRKDNNVTGWISSEFITE